MITNTYDGVLYQDPFQNSLLTYRRCVRSPATYSDNGERETS